MGFFDSKQVKEEKRIYEALSAIKDSSSQLQIWLSNKTEKEFLSSKYKERIISIYRAALEIFNNNEITQAFGLKNLGVCYDFIARYYNTYEAKKDKLGIDFMTYLQMDIRPELQQKQAEKKLKSAQREYAAKSIEFERSAENMEIMVQQISNFQQAGRTYESVPKSSNSLFNEIAQQDFEQKFPQYKELQALITRYQTRIISPEQEKIVSDTIAKGKQHYPNFTLEDMLMPYLEEKSGMRILSDGEKKLFYSKVGYDVEAAQRLITYISLNADMFYKEDKRARENFIKSFEKSHLKIDVFYSQGDKESLLYQSQQSFGQKR